ncbi:MAG: sulfite exporter TauE/SafE family protein [Flavobacteriales bacterium]
MEISIIVSALLLGLGGSLHCLGMCGPIAFTLSIDKRYKNKILIQNTLYQMGRIITYSTLGIFAGLVGKSFNIIGLQSKISIITGVLLILSVLISFDKAQKFRFFKPFNIIIAKLKVKLSHYIKKPHYSSFIIIGLLNGLLPCGMVYVALTASVSAGSIGNSFLFMLLFGLGTFPLMFLAVWVGNYAGMSWRSKIERILPFIIVFVGVLFILRGLNLGIPLISPNLSGGQNCH